MKFTTLAILLITLTLTGCGTTSNIGPTITTPRKNFLVGAKMNLIVFDVRADQHEGLQLEKQIQTHLINTYPRTWINQRDKAYYFKGVDNGVITIKLKIQEYDVTARQVAPSTTAGGGGYTYSIDDTRGNAVMDLIVNVYDSRKGVKTQNIEIIEAYPVGIKPDGGYSNDGMQLVFQKSMERLANFLDANLMN
jgi:hypothetical protein